MATTRRGRGIRSCSDPPPPPPLNAGGGGTIKCINSFSEFRAASPPQKKCLQNPHKSSQTSTSCWLFHAILKLLTDAGEEASVHGKIPSNIFIVIYN